MTVDTSEKHKELQNAQMSYEQNHLFSYDVWKKQQQQCNIAHRQEEQCDNSVRTVMCLVFFTKIMICLNVM